MTIKFKLVPQDRYAKTYANGVAVEFYLSYSLYVKSGWRWKYVTGGSREDLVRRIGAMLEPTVYFDERGEVVDQYGERGP